MFDQDTAVEGSRVYIQYGAVVLLSVSIENATLFRSIFRNAIADTFNPIFRRVPVEKPKLLRFIALFCPAVP